MSPLYAISPIDGKYSSRVRGLEKYFSEAALIRYRVLAEVEYLIALSAQNGVGLKRFSQGEQDKLRKIAELSEKDVQIVKDIETKGHKKIPATNHDVKAVEYFIREKLQSIGLERASSYIHFALTSEDINSLAYGLCLSDALEKETIPSLDKVISAIDKRAKQYKKDKMVARTHGQVASPTTFGKELSVFSYRLNRQLKQLKNIEIGVKLNGATGNYNAHLVAYPDIDWLGFTDKLVEALNKGRILKLTPETSTTQIVSGDSYAEVFDCLRRINVILLDASQDMWRYISDGLLIQNSVKGEVGSSTMPHKVNPIDFENAEGNLGIANALLNFFSNKLPVSRLQRDLSDSTVKRNFGVALAHSQVAYMSFLKGLDKIRFDKDKALNELQNHPEVITEAIQTILRREGLDGAYERLKEASRGKKITLDSIHQFIEELDVSENLKNELKKIKPENYTGLSDK